MSMQSQSADVNSNVNMNSESYILRCLDSTAELHIDYKSLCSQYSDMVYLDLLGTAHK